ncbi:MAG: acetyltransferase [Pseudomonadales bacterium]|nr:acetyltransferase [Pseudomonadales bacterium]
MLLKQISTGRLIEVETLNDLTNPLHSKVSGQMQWGEELPDPEVYAKHDLSFPSDEPLPQCWKTTHYRDHELVKQSSIQHANQLHLFEHSNKDTNNAYYGA